jgi:hypothetical protein
MWLWPNSWLLSIRSTPDNLQNKRTRKNFLCSVKTIAFCMVDFWRCLFSGVGWADVFLFDPKKMTYPETA